MRSHLRYIALLISLCFLASFNLAGQEEFLTDKVYKSSIKTVQFHRAGWDMTYPVIELNGMDQLELSFDDLSEQVGNYSYTLVHCDADWMPSRIVADEYIEGFTENPLQDYALSFNTTVNYVHYKLLIPNDEVRIRLSGNYILKVFEDYNQNKLALTQRFSVSESLASIEGRASRPVLDPFRDEGHQVSFQVTLGSVQVNDPYSEIKVAIQQNNRWNMSIRNLKPLFNRGKVLDYSYQEDNVFKAGNEYRYFDFKSLRYQSQFIKSIEYQVPNYHIYLYPDEARDRRPYFYNEDLNGRYFIEVQEGTDREIESDYVYVHFTLPQEVPIITGDLYISGALTNWDYKPENRMVYNFEKKAYEQVLLLKQGHYNYEYVLLREDSLFPDATFIEGSHYETENDYVIYVYLSTTTSRYDRLIGYQFLNSIR